MYYHQLKKRCAKNRYMNKQVYQYEL